MDRKNQGNQVLILESPTEHNVKSYSSGNFKCTTVVVNCQDIWEEWSSYNKLIETLILHLASKKSSCFDFQIQQETYDVEKNMEMLRKAIMDKSNPLKVAHTRLEARSHRRDVELCRDGAQTR